MSRFIKPKLVISRCLGFAKCRYNALVISDEFINELKDYVEVITPCPEADIGLGIPRDPIRLVKGEEDEVVLFQPSTSRDLTQKMKSYSRDFLDSLGEVDGFILKDRSPSCGTKDVKVYLKEKKGITAIKSSGIFAKEVIDQYSPFPIENEGRLRNFTIRESFLTEIFLLARFRSVEEKESMGDLVEFHSRAKLILFSYSELEMRKMGKIVANHKGIGISEVLALYRQSLLKSFKEPSKFTAHINVLEHAFGHFSKDINKEEKKFFLDILNKYRHGKVPLSVPMNILSVWIIKYNKSYLDKQFYFNPYPEGLVEISDSGKGRDF